MTTTTPSRRQRLRTATVTEIKGAARAQLRAGGPAAVSLRAIARDMGMTAPGLYRYFPSLDALVIELVTDLFDEARAAVEQARDAAGETDPVARLAALTRGFRRWAVGNPHEFALLFGSPVAGVTQFDQHCENLDVGGARFGAVFLDTLAEVYALHPPPAEPTADALDDVLQPYLDAYGDRLPRPVVYAFLAGWTRIYGLVAMEVFGHLRWALTEVEPLFETELRRTLASLTSGD